MPGAFYEVGLIEPSNTGHSFKVYTLTDGKRVFIGLVSRKALAALSRNEISQADICRFSENTAAIQEPLSFNLEPGPHSTAHIYVGKTATPKPPSFNLERNHE